MASSAAASVLLAIFNAMVKINQDSVAFVRKKVEELEGTSGEREKRRTMVFELVREFVSLHYAGDFELPKITDCDEPGACHAWAGVAHHRKPCIHTMHRRLNDSESWPLENACKEQSVFAAWLRLSIERSMPNIHRVTVHRQLRRHNNKLGLHGWSRR
jgi:hypothetical protein